MSSLHPSVPVTIGFLYNIYRWVLRNVENRFAISPHAYFTRQAIATQPCVLYILCVCVCFGGCPPPPFYDLREACKACDKSTLNAVAPCRDLWSQWSLYKTWNGSMCATRNWQAVRGRDCARLLVKPLQSVMRISKKGVIIWPH